MMKNTIRFKKRLSIEEFEIQRNEYAERMYKKAIQYEKDVEGGKIIACQWIKKAIKRRKKLHKKYYFDKQSVIDTFRFFYIVYITVDNEIKRFEPFGWQCWIVLNTYGYYRDKTLKKRLFRYVTIWVARKSSKTTFAAILSLYGLVKGERNSESYFCATTKKQASQALKYLKRIIKDSPILKQNIKIRRYHLEYEGNGSCTAEPVPNEPDTLDGLSPSFVIIDEKHALSDNALFNIMKTGTLARQNPLMITISTSGVNRDYPFYAEVGIGKKVLDGEIDDDSTFYAFYQLDDEKEIDNSKMWIKSNPSLKDKDGVGVISLEDLIVDFDKASLVKADRINFIVKNLNLYQDSEQTWIPDSAYRRVFTNAPLKDLIGGRCYLGLDLSKSRDLSSLVAIVEHPKTKKLYTLPEFYFPIEENEDRKIRAESIDLTTWIKKGFIIEHQNRIIDWDAIFDRISWFNDMFDVRSLGYDQWHASPLINRVEAELGIETVICPQNTSFFTFPISYAERLIFSEEISLSKNPVLRWNFRNVIMYFDGNGNCKPMKNKSLDSIDGLIAFLEALGMYARENYDSIIALYTELIKDKNKEEKNGITN